LPSTTGLTYPFTGDVLFTYTRKTECLSNMISYNAPTTTSFDLPVLDQGTPFQELISAGYLTS